MVVLATLGEARAASRIKSWGKLLKIRPLLPDDPLDPLRIVYLHKETSPHRQAYERRARLKQALGRAGKRLVQRARKLSKDRFLKELRPEEETIIRTRLGIAASDFWQACQSRPQHGGWQGVLPFSQNKK